MFQEKIVWEFKRGKTLTTQVVRKSHFKKRRRGFIKGSKNQNYQRGREEYQRKKKVQP
jgi:hypothetical protein